MVLHILSDIEGTSTSIAYVHQTLFPFALSNIETYLRKNKDNPELNSIFDAIIEDYRSHDTLKITGIDDIIETLKSLIRSDIKYGPLKLIQGLMCKEGYQNKLFEGHVYPEVKNELMYWNSRNLKVSIYSSGSVEAQKLLFTYSTSGDLSPYLYRYFDTSTGPKQEVTSYKQIASALSAEPSQILFLSDIFEELSAAEQAGLKACQLVREAVKRDYRVQAKTFKEVTQIFGL